MKEEDETLTVMDVLSAKNPGMQKSLYLHHLNTFRVTYSHGALVLLPCHLEEEELGHIEHLRWFKNLIVCVQVIIDVICE